MGGLSSDSQILKSCYEIDPNMNMIERLPMKTARFSIALTVLFDKYVFALGGTISKGSNAKATDTCEVYDALTNVWYPVPSLN